MAKAAAPARLLVSMLAAAEPPRVEALRRLVERLGPLVYLSQPLEFSYTAYYQREMGGPLTRRLAAFRDLLPSCRLPEVKRLCVALEAELARDGRRRVNLDPGMLSADSLVLASGKPQAHRLALAEDVWGEITLLYHHGQFHGLLWTYPDYAAERMRRLLAGLRGRYLWQLLNERARGEDK